jgi:hypothetical protein
MGDRNANHRVKETGMAFRFRKAAATTAEARESTGGWFADPYGTAARRWYDNRQGWTDQVQGEGEEPDQTGLARVDKASAEGQGGGPRAHT